MVLPANYWTRLKSTLSKKILGYWKGATLKGVNVDLANDCIEDARRSCSSFEVLSERLQELNLEIERGFLNEIGYQDAECDLKEKNKIFDKSYYQCGSLDDEMPAILAALSTVDNPRVLEIGVANGYSSAHVYNSLKDCTDSYICSIDMPRFSDTEKGAAKIYVNLLKNVVSDMRLIDSKSILDLRPGGIIPKTKSVGWMVPAKLRDSQKNSILIGNALYLVPGLEKTFNFAIVDAMKDYQGRMSLLEALLDKLQKGAILVQDGYWINSAFVDFCNKFNFPYVTVGRVGLARVN